MNNELKISCVIVSVFMFCVFYVLWYSFPVVLFVYLYVISVTFGLLCLDIFNGCFYRDL